VKIDCGYVVPPGVKFYYLSLLFSKGLEIRSNRSEFTARFFRYQELVTHDLLVAQYRKQYPAADRPLMPYLSFPPLLPDAVDPKSLPSTIDVRFMVTERGEVDSLVVDQPLDPLAEHAIQRALDGWLFMPRLKAGQPVRTLVKLPLSFN
jgi:hypothetical protein